MNAKEAKQIPLTEILSAKGYNPHHKRGADVWYISPFRAESTASFKINLHKNIWFDFGLGEGGNVFDLFKHLYNENSIASILAMLQNFSSSPVINQVSLLATTQKTASPIIQSIREIENSALIAYLKTRGLSLERAKLFLSEIHYQTGDKSYFALAHPNELGGFEIRNKYFKGSLNKKSFSLIEGTTPHKQLAIFEGMFDFLSLLELHQINTPAHDVLVLNSLSFVKPALEYVKKQNYQRFNLYLDNDKAGEQATQEIIIQLEKFKVSDQSKTYTPYKDINDYLLERKQKEINLQTALSQQDPFSV